MKVVGSFLIWVSKLSSLTSPLAIITTVFVATAGLPCEPRGPAFLLKERQTSVQEARSRHQRVDSPSGGGGGWGRGQPAAVLPLLSSPGETLPGDDAERKPKTTTFTDVCKRSLCKIHFGLILCINIKG